MASEELKELVVLLDPSEIIEQDSPQYAAETLTWADQKNLKPKLVIRPKDVDSLRKAVAFLNKSSLQFGVRSQGFGSGSARDVLISMTAFTQFEFDRESETVLLGAGQSWGDYYEKMESVAPDYQVVAVRIPGIGVGGSIPCGGFSWMSKEFGCTSDPQNLLDAQVVKLDGSVVWASTEPDLLFALRGSGGGYGIVTMFRLKAHKYPQDIFCGPIMIPRSSIDDIAKGIAFSTNREPDPKMSMFLYLIPKERLGPEAEEDVLAVHAYDACGEGHARSEAGFKWALDIPGAKDYTGVMNLRGVANLTAGLGESMGKSTFYGNPVALKQQVSAETVYKVLAWYDKLAALGPSFSRYSLFVLELSCIRDPIGCNRLDLAWPRPSGIAHYITTGLGYTPEHPQEKALEALEMLKNASEQILGIEYGETTVIPNQIEEFHDIPSIFGANYERLKAIKQKYDPQNRLVSPIQA